MVIQRFVFLCGAAEEIDFTSAEKFTGNDESVAVIVGDLFFGKFTFAHVRCVFDGSVDSWRERR
jgi:hypothetical protein